MSEEELSTWQKKLFGWVIVAVLGGNAGAMINFNTEKARSDPFTGTQGEELSRDISRINAIQQTMLHRMGIREQDNRDLKQLIEAHLRRHP